MTWLPVILTTLVLSLIPALIYLYLEVRVIWLNRYGNPAQRWTEIDLTTTWTKSGQWRWIDGRPALTEVVWQPVGRTPQGDQVYLAVRQPVADPMAELVRLAECSLAQEFWSRNG